MTDIATELLRVLVALVIFTVSIPFLLLCALVDLLAHHGPFKWLLRDFIPETAEW